MRGTAPRATSSCAGRPDRETWPGLFEDHAGFTHVEELAVTIAGQQFPQLLCHFVMVYNRWGHVSVVLARECFSRPSGHAAVRRKITSPTASRWVAERRAGVFADPPHPSATWTLTSVRILPCVMNAFAGHFGGGAPAVRQALWGSIYRDSLFPRNEYAAAWKVPQRDLPARLLHRHIHRIASKRAWEAFAAL